MNAGWRVLVAAAAVGLAASLALAEAPPAEVAARVDKVFAKWDSARSPGCAVAVGEAGKPVLARAYGMSDLERDSPNTVDTVFEAGSERSPANRVVFQLDATGRVGGLHWIDSDGTTEYVRAETVAMDAADRAAYTGRYFAEEADAMIAVTVDGDDLVVSNGPDFSAKLVPVDRNIFSLPSVGAFVFERGSKGKVNGFRFFSGRLRGLRFDRQEARR